MNQISKKKIGAILNPWTQFLKVGIILIPWTLIAIMLTLLCLLASIIIIRRRWQKITIIWEVVFILYNYRPLTFSTFLKLKKIPCTIIIKRFVTAAVLNFNLAQFQFIIFYSLKRQVPVFIIYKIKIFKKICWTFC